jgi:hypothetical protein
MQPYQLKAGGNQIAILIGLKPVTANFLMRSRRLVLHLDDDAMRLWPHLL